MSTWKIFPGAGNDFRWEISGRDPVTKREEEPIAESIPLDNSDSRLPSMADILLEECSKLLEDRRCGGGGNGSESSSMFKTGLGNFVAVKPSSIAKALSVIGEDDVMDTESSFSNSMGSAGQVFGRNGGCSFSDSLFQTGSGNNVNISSAGLLRAKTLLGLEEDDANITFHRLENRGKPSTTNKQHGLQNSSYSEMREGANGVESKDVISAPRSHLNSTTDLLRTETKKEEVLSIMQSEMFNSSLKPAPIKFHTAGGKSLSVSSDALQRARSLLGYPELGMFINEGSADDPVCSFSKDRRFVDSCLSKENNDLYASFSHQGVESSKYTSNSFVSPLRSSSKELRLSKNRNLETNIVKKFDEDEYDGICRSNNDISYLQKRLSSNPKENASANGFGSKINMMGRSSHRPLVDISNSIGKDYTNKKEISIEKKRLGRKSSISPFKRPRNSRFSAPLKSNISTVPNGTATVALENSSRKGRLSTRYPFQSPRVYMKEYFQVSPFHKHMLDHLPDQVKCMVPYNAEKYMFSDESGSSCIGVESFCHILAQCGASMQYASKEWVTNHYKWVVWKLACYDRCYPAKSTEKFLSFSNVLEELKYRYEREVNHGHRSAIKRILEGDAQPSSMLVLCISAIHSNSETQNETEPMALNRAENSTAAKLELTDGWYAMDALLDGLLSKQLAAGKLFVGQKLRVWGAGLCGWAGPVSPLEVSRTASLVLHMNGTYRAHWADRLGLCKIVGAPLAFRCIKSTGGLVPQTWVGITRIYPLLYKERLNSGSSIVRSERLETKMMQLHNQRRSNIIEGIVSEFQMGIKDSHFNNDSDSEEGAKILKILETAAEPEVIMAEMTSEQLTSFATYQAKLEAIRHTNMQKLIEKALEDAGLGAREVTPFMRVRVVGLTGKSNKKKHCHKEGLITIWDPTEKPVNSMQFQLVEGQAYGIAGLMPLKYDSEILYLQGRGSTTKWWPLSPPAIEQFDPRKSVLLSKLGEVPLSSEFDIAALVVHVGEVYTAAHQKRQWVFVTDGSISELQWEESPNSLLAISFCSPYVDDDSFAPINYNLAGSTIGFCNLIKRASDQINHLWVADATENSTYFLNYDSPHSSHLKNAAASAQSWGKISASIIEKLREKVLSIINDSKG